MPSTYTHFKFGNEIYPRLPKSIQESIDIAPELFQIGQHGPDILFCYHIIRSNPISRLGHQLHDMPAAEFFEPALNILRNTKIDHGERAYLYGFVCHFILDSCTHWYIDRAMNEQNLGHSWIEGEFDRQLMEKDGLDPVSHPAADHIVASKENAKIIARFFPSIPEKKIHETLNAMLHCFRLLCCPEDLKRKTLLWILKRTGHYDDVGGMIMKPAADPRCAHSNARLLRLFEIALKEAERYLCEFETAIETGRPLSERFLRTYGPDRKSQEIYNEWIPSTNPLIEECA